ncbi:hypothetical protein A1351_18075 [Methylosinus sp. R-45379]|nr:hypothetical protein A1351_18075 [Methylosinus sp. R-45379]
MGAYHGVGEGEAGGPVRISVRRQLLTLCDEARATASKQYGKTSVCCAMYICAMIMIREAQRA